MEADGKSRTSWSSYVRGLPPEARLRYQNKISYQKGTEILPDPYHIAKSEWVNDPCLWPELDFGQVYVYLIDTPSVYTKASMKAYKSLEAYRSRKTTGTLVVPGHGLQHVSTLVKLLNENPNMSKDRFVRVRQTSYHNTDNSNMNNSDDSGISLFEDFAYLLEEDKSFGLGRIQRMQRHFQNPKKTIDYKSTIPFNCDYLAEVTVTLSAYEKLDDSVYKLNGNNIVQTKASYILSHVNLTFDENRFSLNSEEKITITEAITNIFEKSKNRRIRRNMNQNEEFDGRYSIVVTPQEQIENGRTSNRIRKQIHFVS